jgi:hypothetical protein
MEAAQQVEVAVPEWAPLARGHLPATESVGSVRFSATALPTNLVPAARDEGVTVAQSRGLDQSGHVVACLVPGTAVGGISPLADCR